MSNENLAFLCGMQKFASESGIPLEVLVKKAGVANYAGRMLGKAFRSPGKIKDAINYGAIRTQNAARDAMGNFLSGLRGKGNVNSAGASALRSAYSAKIAPRPVMPRPPPMPSQQAAPSVATPSATNVPQPIPTPAGASGLRGIFDAAKNDLGTMAGNVRSGNWEAAKQMLRANPARWAGYGAGGLYAGGVAKDYADLINRDDEYDFSPIGKLMMGLGIQDKPGIFDPLNPFHRRRDGFWG